MAGGSFVLPPQTVKTLGERGSAAPFRILIGTGGVYIGPLADFRKKNRFLADFAPGNPQDFSKSGGGGSSGSFVLPPVFLTGSISGFVWAIGRHWCFGTIDR